MEIYDFFTRRSLPPPLLASFISFSFFSPSSPFLPPLIPSHFVTLSLLLPPQQDDFQIETYHLILTVDKPRVVYDRANRDVRL